MILDHIQLAMPENGEEAARRFYGDVLGLTEEPKPPRLRARGGCWFRRGACAVHLGVDPDFRAQRRAHPAFGTGKLAELAERLGASGHEVTWDDAVPGVRRFYTADPFGNRIELIERSPVSGAGESGGGSLPTRSPAPRVGIGCIVVRDGRWLLVRSRRSGRWSTPGGNLESGESPEECASREVEEETGVRVTRLELACITNDILDGSGGHYVTVWLRGHADDGRISIGDETEIVDAGWFLPEDFPEPRHLYFENLLAGRLLGDAPLRGS